MVTVSSGDANNKKSTRVENDLKIFTEVLLENVLEKQLVSIMS